jgi:AbrB family looped-hinge helix DNA binding protein
MKSMKSMKLRKLRNKSNKTKSAYMLRRNITVETTKVGERGQVVIPKVARDILNIKPGDTLIVFAKPRRGVFLCHANEVKGIAKKLTRGIDD